MRRTRRRRENRGDDGVSLVLALVFILIVGLFITAALTKSQATLVAGQSVRDRGQLQYGLDGGIDRAIQVVRSDMGTADPSVCAQPTPAAAAMGSGSLTLNATTTSWSCQLMAGRAKKSSDSDSTDYAIVVTSPASGALTTQSGSGTFKVGGSVYLNGEVKDSDINTNISVSGDIVSPSSDASCAAHLDAMTKVAVSASNYLKTCSEQSASSAEPTVSLPTAPGAVYDISTLYASGLASGTCRVYFPGLYTSAPSFTNGDNYMVSGLYYFKDVAVSLNSNSSTLIGGRRTAATDSPALTGSCATMTDTTALGLLPAALRSTLTSSGYVFASGGVTWVLGGTAAVTISKGVVSLFSPAKGSSSQPMSIVAYKTATNGYAGIATGIPSVISGGTNNVTLQVNGKIFAPSGRVDLTATGSGSVQQALGGIVGYEVALKASTPAFGLFNVSAPAGAGSPPPPFRTIQVVASTSGNSARNTAVFTVSNFGTYAVKVKSWRTS